MKILILSQWYFPETVSGKINSIGKELIKQGHSITVFTGFPNYPTGKIYNGYKLKVWQKEIIDGVNIVRFPSYLDHSTNKFKRIFNYFSLLLSVSILGFFFLGKKDVIFLFDSLLSMGFPSILFSKFKRIDLIWEIQDMYPETLAATNMVTSKTILRYINKFVIYICRKAKYITVISNGFKQNLIEKGIDKEKISVIPNWTEDFFYPMKRKQELLDAYELNNKFNIVYAGNIGIAQQLENVLKVANKLSKFDKINFVLIGDGNYLDKLKYKTKQFELSNVHFIDRQPVKRISEFLSMADVLLIHLKSDPIFEITIPSKSIAYLAVGKPILCVSLGDVQKLIFDAKAGVSCEPGNIDKFTETVLTLYNMRYSDLIKLGKNGRHYYEQNFSKVKIMQEYKNLFNNLSK